MWLWSSKERYYEAVFYLTTKIKDIKFDKDTVTESFYKTITNSNFLLLKCYKLIFSLKGLINNKGSYLMLLFTFNLIAIIIKFIIKGQSTMDYFIMTIFHFKYLVYIMMNWY